MIWGCSSENSPDSAESSSTAVPSSFLYVWAADEDQASGDTDFLAVLDSNPNSPSYGEVISTAAVGAVGTNAHHAEPVAPIGSLLFANGYESGRTFLFDLSSPSRPVMLRELEPIEGFAYPHSFLRLDDGTLLATFQYGDGSQRGNPGGVVLFDED